MCDNKIFNQIYFDCFDEVFYNQNYKITNGEINKNELFDHWLKYGKKLNYVMNNDQLKDRVLINENFNNQLLDLLEFKTNDSIEFNILIRTSERPEFFKKCIESIQNQNFGGKVNIYVSCDTYITYDYVRKYDNIKYIFLEKYDQSYGFNLYCNKLLDEVKDGWIIFLDDDDMFLTEKALEIISSNIKNENDLIIWNFIRPDKIIKPKMSFSLGELDTTCFCFHNKFKKKSEWIAKRCSDYYFFKKLDQNVKFNKKFLNISLVKTIYNNYIAGYGENK